MSGQLFRPVTSRTQFTVEKILAMSQDQRKEKVTRAEARAHQLTYVDGACGTAQFVGTQSEWEERVESLRGRR